MGLVTLTWFQKLINNKSNTEPRHHRTLDESNNWNLDLEKWNSTKLGSNYEMLDCIKINAFELTLLP